MGVTTAWCSKNIVLNIQITTHPSNIKSTTSTTGSCHIDAVVIEVAVGIIVQVHPIVRRGPCDMNKVIGYNPNISPTPKTVVEVESVEGSSSC